jgi:hypothetical protein
VADFSALAAELAHLTGLDNAVALNWIKAEGSIHPTNPLGILCGNSLGSGLEIGCEGRFARYASVGAGLQAAAWLLIHGSRYGGIRDAIASGSPADQRAAIVASPWAGGGYRKGKGFSSAGISGAADPVGTPGSAPPATAPPSASSSPTTLAALLGMDPSTAITPANYRDIQRRIHELETSGTFTHEQAQNLIVLVAGKAVAAGHGGGAPFTLGSIVVDPTTGGQPFDPFGALFGWVPGFAVNAAVLLTILALGYIGIRRVAG